jgi:hypothetical protein
MNEWHMLQFKQYFLCVTMRILFVWGEKGRWNASVLAQKAQVGKRVPLSCTSNEVLLLLLREHCALGGVDSALLAASFRAQTVTPRKPRRAAIGYAHS